MTYYLTTPIFYVNGSPHIGHAYTVVAADVLARFARLDGVETHFLTGTDEHGQKVEKAAADAGLSPQDFTDRISAEFQAMLATLNISNDDFIRTTEPRHQAGAQALWRTLATKGDIYLGHYEGWYAVRDEDFYGADDLTTLPDGTRLAPTGAPVEWVREPNYLFRLSAYQDRLLAHYEANPDFIGPASKRNEMLSFIRGGLKDLSVSRSSFKWGIPVPGDPAHVMYVWLDALTNYITALGYPDENAPLWRFWPADLHLVGKDIQRFHAVYWPAFLMAAGLPVPKRIFAHGWWTIEGAKMSKSVGNVVLPGDLVTKYGLDPVRFFLLREVPFGNDGDFSPRALVGRLNTDLANGIGNLAQRTLTLIAKNCDGRLPEAGPSTEADDALLTLVAALPTRVRDHMARQALHEALEEIWRVIRAGDGYIDAQAPWSLRKTDIVRMAHVLRVLATALRGIAVVLQPFMPTTMARLLDQLGVAPDARQLAALDQPLIDGTKLPPPQGLFPRWVEPAEAKP
jgi:methionyl-tRNA synthetase